MLVRKSVLALVFREPENEDGVRRRADARTPSPSLTSDVACVRERADPVRSRIAGGVPGFPRTVESLMLTPSSPDSVMTVPCRNWDVGELAGSTIPPNAVVWKPTCSASFRKILSPLFVKTMDLSAPLSPLQ